MLQLCVTAQSSHGLVLSYDPADTKLSGFVCRSPVSLARRLTENKDSEKEKFDAIFAWVAANIHYDYRTYYSSNGAGKTNIKKMLKYRGGICIDYAALMDTLCSLAGIKDVTIYGYAKDEVFDVHDSIYVDNHAWNAVRLDGLWYVYDVTWASGNIDYRYTSFSRQILKWQAKFPLKYKQKKIKKRNTYFFIDECGNEYRSPVYYYKGKWLNNFISKLLGKFRLRVESYYTKKINSAFYLADPDLFAVTHFPDNPCWSLVSGRSMRNFETDSAFYHLEDSFYDRQNRQGRVCSDCDYDVSLDALNKYHYLRNKSYAFNKRNRFISSYCEYNIAGINFEKSKEQEDSLTKVGLLDTAITFLQRSKTSLRTAFRNVDNDFLLQKNKNKVKQMMLLEENKNYTNFVKTWMNQTMIQRRSVRSLENKVKVSLRKYKHGKEKIRRLKTEFEINADAKLSKEKATEIKAYLVGKEWLVDSLNRLIDRCKVRMDSAITNLSLNVWHKVLHHDSLLLPIRRSTSYRMLLKDNMKKLVVEVRKEIPLYKSNYQRDISNVIYMPAKTMFEYGFELLNLIDVRNNYEMDCYEARLLLVKFNELPQAELEDHKNQSLAENKLEYCWLKGKLSGIEAAENGFRALRGKQREALQVIVYENETERRRTHYFSTELLRRKKKYRRIVVNNMHVSNAKLIEVMKEKRTYLNKLKKERREAIKKKPD